MSEIKKALETLLSTINDVDKKFLAPAREMPDQAKIDGYRNLMHLIRFGIDIYLESHPTYPEFVPLETRLMKIMGDNVDSLYNITQINGQLHYRISGKKQNACYLSVSAYAGKNDGSWSTSVSLNLNHNDIDFDEEGNFSFIIGPTVPNEKFRTTEETICLISREYFWDPENKQESHFQIQTVAKQNSPPPITSEDLTNRLKRIATFIDESTLTIPLPGSFFTNTLTPAFPFGAGGQTRGWGTPDNVYALGTFDIEEHQGLKVTFHAHECCYWGVQTWNNYMQSFDYRYHKVSINRKQAKPSSDGSFEILVTRKPYIHPNNITTAGSPSGMLMIRWLLADGLPQQPNVELIDLTN